MLALVAQGSELAQRCKFQVHNGECIRVGRALDCDFPIPWDPWISRQHVEVCCGERGVDVVRLPQARNPLFCSGEAVEQCQVQTGEHFVIGKTTIHVMRAEADSQVSNEGPIEEVTFDPQELHKIPYTDAHKRIDVLTQLPDVIRGARIDSELYERLTGLLLAGVSEAEAVAIVDLDSEGRVESLHWERRRMADGAFRPSTRLVREALKKRQSILHVWHKAAPDLNADYTQIAELDWAFCSPVLVPGDRTWGLYVAGRLENPGLERQKQGGSLKADVRFTEFVAEIIGSVLRENRWERQKTALRQFLAPPVLNALGDDLDTELLEPRECDVTVLFCDLRGFSQKAEESAGNLIDLLGRVSGALELMTEQIHQFGGVTGDFQGDAALGFWGWPFASDEAPLNACRAALGIRQAFAALQGRSDHPLGNFRVGVGVAHGRAVAGKIGTRDQVKLTVFGPVVNLASRLEGMTKQLRVPILLDEATAEIVRERMTSDVGRIRKLARVLPYGMEKPVVVSELLPPVADSSDLTDELVAQYEAGVESFIAGEWEDAYRCLHGMPASDRAQDFLAPLIAQHHRVAPADWDGIIRLPNK